MKFDQEHPGPDGTAVPKDVFDALRSENERLRTQLNAANDKLKSLRGRATAGERALARAGRRRVQSEPGCGAGRGHTCQRRRGPRDNRP